jgi:hypothetical protein
MFGWLSVISIHGVTFIEVLLNWDLIGCLHLCLCMPENLTHIQFHSHIGGKALFPVHALLFLVVV